MVISPHSSVCGYYLEGVLVLPALFIGATATACPVPLTPAETPRAGRKRVVALGLVFLATIGVGSRAFGAAPPPADDAEAPAQFDGTSPTTLTNEPVSVRLLNNTSSDLTVSLVSASITPTSKDDGSSTTLPNEPPGSGEITVGVEVSTASSEFRRVDEAGFTLPAAGEATLSLSIPQPLPTAADGWLTVALQPSGRVVRRQLVVTPPTVAPAVSEWGTTVERWRPGRSTEGPIGAPIPLKSVTCPAPPPTAVVISNDASAQLTSECRKSGDLQISVAGLSEVGTYKGEFEVGSGSVSVQIRHTLVWWWAAAAILSGLLLALWAQGRLDHGWRFQQPGWLRKIENRAQQVDIDHEEKSTGFPWDAYRITPAAISESRRLHAELDRIVESRSRWLRWLPWPAEFMTGEREKLRDGIAGLSTLVEEWPTMADILAKVSSLLHAAPERYGRLAPKFALRAADLLVGRPDLSYEALVARRDEAVAAEEVFAAIDQLDEVRQFIGRFDRPDAGELQEADARVLARARQLVRRAEAMLREVGDATKIRVDVVPVVRRAARVASELPIRVPPAADQPDVSEAVTAQTAGTVNLLQLPLLAVQWLGRSVSGQRFVVGQLTLIILTALIGIWSGLAVLYVGKAWGTVADFASAIAWGFAATAVVTPIVNAVMQLGTRPTDSASKAKAQTA